MTPRDSAGNLPGHWRCYFCGADVPDGEKPHVCTRTTDLTMPVVVIGDTGASVHLLTTADLPAIYEGCAAAVLRMLDARSKLKPEEPPGVTEAMVEAGSMAYGNAFGRDPVDRWVEAFCAMWRAMQAGQAKEGE